MGKKTRLALIALGVVLLGMQFFQPERTNPVVEETVTFEAVQRPSPQVQAILNRACADCHSNRTVWPWYSRVAPASWLVASDVSEAREHLNFSEWGRMKPEKQAEALEEICKEVKGGDMPLWQYRLLHPTSRLTPEETQLLCALSAGK